MKFWNMKMPMVKTKLRNLWIFESLIHIRGFLKEVDTKVIFFVLPSVFSLSAAVLEGISIGLLVPIMKGMIERDFSFVHGIPILGKLVQLFPEALIVERPNAFTFLLIIGIIFSAAIMKNVMIYSSRVVLSYLIEELSSGLRKLIFNRYLSFGKLFFDRNNTGYLHTVLITFTSELTLGAKMLQNLLTELFMLLIYLILMVILSWQLTIFSLLIFPILHYSSTWLVKKLRTTSKFYAVASQELAGDIFNTLSCIPLVKAYTKERHEGKKFSRASDKVADMRFSLAKKQDLIEPLQETVTLAALLVLVASMAFVIVREQATEVSGLLVFFLVIRRAMGSFGVLDKLRFYLARVGGPLAEIVKMRDDKHKFFVEGGEEEFSGLKNAIEFRRMNFSYIENIPVLTNLGFSIEKGKMVALVGPTGAGKSTIINLLMRFYDCAPNSLLIDGGDIRNFTVESLRRHMAFISQDVLLFNDTLRVNITYGLSGKVSEEKLMDVVQKAQLSDFVAKLPKGLNTWVGDRGVRLSGGEKQRVSVARALLKESEILVLDEATSALDSRTERLIQSAIDQAVKGRTSIVVAHRLSTIRHADKIVVIEGGHVVEEGGLQELLDKKGKFYTYWEEQKFF